MLTTLWATVRNGKIELLYLTEIPEEEQFLLPDEETDFWLQSSQSSLDAIWENKEDEVYAQLLLNS